MNVAVDNVAAGKFVDELLAEIKTELLSWENYFEAMVMVIILLEACKSMKKRREAEIDADQAAKEKENQ